MEIVSLDMCKNNSDNGKTKCRPFCVTPVTSTLTVHVVETGLLLHGSGCPATKMHTYVPLCFSPILANRESFKENPKGQSYCNSHYFNMAVATLVPLALENERKKSVLTSSQKHPSHEPSKVKSPTHRIGKLKTSGMVNFNQQMEAEGISEKAAKLITNARSGGTQARYKSAWNKWVSWCTQRQADPFQCSVDIF